MANDFYFKCGDNITITSGSTAYTTPINLEAVDRFSIQTNWTIASAATCVASVWASNKKYAAVADDTDWVQVTDISVSSPTSATGKAILPYDNFNHRWFRLKFVNSAGTNDDIDVTANLKLK